MNHLVVDASVVVKWVLPERGEEADVDKALGILEGIKASNIVIHQPLHWLAETAAVIERLSPDTAAADIQDLYDLNFEIVDGRELYLKACEISTKLNHHLFDTLYHAAALLLGDAVLVTADRKYFKKAQAYGNIALLENAEF
ncbi:MAG: type II toxin-antitoxin system VapC family toxin [Desulfobacteraceae bacterium]|nr:type II toxin-antitoxin system VapC family toxin [Desulfobacteraceae bacterium]